MFPSIITSSAYILSKSVVPSQLTPLVVLCHNICVVIQSMYELGIDATFWGTSAIA